MSGLSKAQVDQLLKPINGRRVQKLDGMSHLAAYDVRAHLNRIFGFGQWSGQVIDTHLLYEQETALKSGKAGWKVAYRVRFRLALGEMGVSYVEEAVGESIMPDFKRGDCHDMAIKTGASQALKRCATNLGDQFGLSLYADGSQAALVGATLYYPFDDAPATGDVTEHITEPLPVENEAVPDAPVETNEPAEPTLPMPDPGLVAEKIIEYRTAAMALPPKGIKPQAYFARITTAAARDNVLNAMVKDQWDQPCTLNALINARMVAAQEARAEAEARA